MAGLRGAFMTQMTKMNQIGDQPSIFDVMSQESLMKSLKPALRHLTKYLAFAYPEKFSSLSQKYDEFYFLFDFFLQNHFLTKYGASFSENFYGMKRIFQATGEMPMKGWTKLRSIFILVIWPYLRDKLDKLHDDLKLRLSYIGNANQDFKVKLAKVFVKYYPWFKSIIGALTVFLQIAYIINRSYIHSPFLWASGVRLEKLTGADLASFDGLPAHLQPTGILQRLWRIFLAIPGVMYRLFGYGLFFVQFVDFMYNSDLGAQLKGQKASWKTPPPPHNLLLNESNIHTLETNKCPICLKNRENSTALSVSGYVFCYTCIDSHLKKFGKCPLTGLPANTSQLIRLYH
ncbi:unnamed protein product, partial [Mesorhabditis belari]|uniref:Peroxisome assembly protein 12 n=1 Tax=Mesorhabditis belari TaxID=2138241 RepID=A0AAF3ETF3_9BILA